MGPSRKTEAYYRDHIQRRMLGFMADNGISDLPDITPDTLRDWLAFEKSSTYTRKGGGVHTLANSTLIQRRAAANHFFEWCVEQEYIPFSPMRKVRSIRADACDRVAFPLEEAVRLVREAGRAPGWLSARDKAIVRLLFDTGARASELLGLTAQSFEWPQRKVKLKGKGGRIRRVPLGSNASEAVRNYLRVRPASRHSNLFVTQRGTAMAYPALNMMLSNLGKYARVEGVIPHRFRHTYAAEHYRKHHDIMALRDLLGHSKIETTMTYLRSLGVDYGSSAGYETPGEWLE